MADVYVVLFCEYDTTQTSSSIPLVCFYTVATALCCITVSTVGWTDGIEA